MRSCINLVKFPVFHFEYDGATTRGKEDEIGLTALYVGLVPYQKLCICSCDILEAVVNESLSVQ